MAVKFKIESNSEHGKTKIFADDIEIKGVKKYMLTHEAGKDPVLTLEFPVVEIEVIGETRIIVPEKTAEFLLKKGEII